jgi:hypothetical protein
LVADAFTWSWSYNEDELGAIFNRELSTLAPLLKHQSFAEEQEWRLVSAAISIKDKNVHVRDSSSRLLPHFRFRLRDRKQVLELSRLTIGPTPEPQINKIGVWSSLAVHNATAAKIEVSSVPFRAW